MTKILQDIVQTKANQKTEAFFRDRKKTINASAPEKIPLSGQKKSGVGHGLWFVALIAIVFLVFAISILFSSASVTITPKQQEVKLEDSVTFSATKNASGTALSFDLVVLSGTETKIVPATGVKNITTKATGKVAVFNKFSTAPQNLTIGTRLEGSNGKIYKTSAKVTVPAMQKDGTPGSVDVTVTAEKEGTEYNSAPLDFKILGFKGTPKYEKIFGRSKGEIAGGFVGSQPDITDAEMTSATNELKDNLQKKLLQKATNQLPEGFILYKDAVSLEFDATPIAPVMKDTGAELAQKGTLYGFIFNEKKLTDVIARKLIQEYDGSDLYIQNIKTLSFLLLTKDGVGATDSSTITFNISGTPKIVYRVDTEKLLNDLLTSNKKDFQNILTKYPTITSADLSIKPIWKSSFPDTESDIHLLVQYPK